tara:strand:+ start:72 stop:395 length:324 start_codon:yes stop_codon:yes gene_type:complete
MTDRPLPAQGFFPIFYWPNVPYLKIFRRPDFVILAEGSFVVPELKGETTPSQAYIDQVASYASDLRAIQKLEFAVYPCTSDLRYMSIGELTIQRKLGLIRVVPEFVL